MKLLNPPTKKAFAKYVANNLEMSYYDLIDGFLLNYFPNADISLNTIESAEYQEAEKLAFAAKDELIEDLRKMYD